MSYRIWRSEGWVRIVGDANLGDPMGTITLTEEEAAQLARDLAPQQGGAPFTRAARNAEICRLYTEENMGISEIGKRLALTRATIANILGNYIFDSPRQNPYIQRRK